MKKSKGFRKLLSLFLVLTVMMTLAGVSLNPITVLAYSDGSVYGSTKNLPGTIQAEEFNYGGMNAAYRVDMSGNQGDAGFRIGEDVDIYNGGSGRYIQSSSGSDFFEWIKYTVNVTAAGWYSIQLTGKSAGYGDASMSILFDDAFASSAALPAGSFTTVTTDKPVYLTSGTHVMKVQFFMSSTSTPALDYINVVSTSFTPTSPSVMTTWLFTDEVTIADIDVTQAPYYADDTGQNDSTSAIQAAIDKVSLMRGGTVFLPAGKYKVLGNLTLKPGVSMLGDWENPVDDPTGAAGGTLLMAYAGQGTGESGTPFISMSWGSGILKNLSIWYPNQSASSPSQYPYTIEMGGGGNALKNITLYNSYNGINDYTPGSYDNDIGDIYGTVLYRGLKKGGDINPGHVYNIRFDTTIWEDAPGSIITNKPTSNDITALRNYTSANLIGMHLGEIDNMMAYNISLSDYYKGIWVNREYIGPCVVAAYGPMSKVNASFEVDSTTALFYPDMFMRNTDVIPDTASLSYTFATPKKPYNLDGGAENFFNVKAAPYYAVGDGLTDDTTAIQNALNAAATNGGTVYLPQGQYKVTDRLTVPAGVELRGIYQSYNSWQEDACTLLAYDGKDTSDPDNADAFITLGADSGVRGFNIAYPEQGVNNAAEPMHAYPFTIRASASNVWIVNVSPYNAYNFIDFNGANNHTVAGIRGGVLNKGIVVRAGSSGGKLERICFAPYVSYFASRGCYPTAYYRPVYYTINMDPYFQFLYDNFKPFIFGNSTNETTFGTFVWWHNTGYTFLNDGAGCTNSTFWAITSDGSKNSGFQLEGGNNNKFVGAVNIVATTEYGGTGKWIKDTASFAGKTLTIYDHQTDYLSTYPTPEINYGYLVMYDLNDYPTAGYHTHTYGTPPGSSGLVSNPGFENGSLSPWIGYSGGMIDSSNARTGSYCAKVNATGTGDSGVYQTISGLSPNTAYRLTAYARATAGGTSYIGVKNYGGTEVNQSTTSTGYTQLTVNFTTGSSDTSALIYLWTPDGADAFADDFEVVPAAAANYAANPGFEQNGGLWTDPTGWYSWTDTGSYGADFVDTNGGAYSGTYFLAHWDTSAYRIYTHQVINNLDPGLYTFSAWVQSSGGQNTAAMVVKQYGGNDINQNVSASSTWTKVSISNIQVSTGTCEIGFWSDANANNWIRVDEVELIKQ